MNLFGDCLTILPTILTDQVDHVFTDPPYPMIKRDYGKWTVEEWEEVMHACVKECRRILKPKGSMVIVLQPNSEHVGQMRPWLWDFISWASSEWNVVQDFYWINPSICPTAHAKYWIAQPYAMLDSPSHEPDCMRYQDEVLAPLAESTLKISG